jgi:polyhydroxyalkanoate synthesis regulator phasin
MFNKKISAVLIATAMTLGTVSAASADAGHLPGVPPQVSTVLSSLVTKGTITQAQADAITAALTAAAPTPLASGAPSIGGMKGDKDGRGGFMGGFGMNTAARQAIITSTLGITAADLQTARQAGKSLATIAGTKTAALITALVNYDSTQIDAAVTAGKLTSAQATTMKANLTTLVTKEVNNTGHGPDGGHGMMGGAPKIPAPTSTATTSAYKKPTVKKA